MFAATLFLCAFLLFWLEPLFSKAVLPSLGGAPAVWNTALVFFQAALLRGRTPPPLRASTWAVLTRSEALLAALREDGWSAPDDPRAAPLWTDRHTSLLEVLRW